MVRWIDEQRIAVGRGPGDQVSPDIAAGAAAIVDDDRLAPELAELVGEHASKRIGWSARRERHDDAHSAGRIALRRHRRVRHGAEHRAHGREGEQTGQSIAHVVIASSPEDNEGPGRSGLLTRAAPAP